MAEQITPDQIAQLIEEGATQAQEILSDPVKIQELMDQLSEKVKQLPSAAGEALGNIPLMASMVKSYVTKEYDAVSPKVIVSLVTAFLYLVAAKDVIRDDIPVLGIADDIAVIAFVMKLNEQELMVYQQWRQSNQMPEVQIDMEA